jgi:hypothetical protein
MDLALWITAGLRARGLHRRGPADVATYTDLFELWSQAAHREVLSSYQLGFVRPRHSSRRRPPLPLLQFLVAPGESIDFAHPRSGFTGLDSAPPAERVLTLWADDLLSVRHGDDWIYVIDAERPLTQAWLGLLAPPGGLARPAYAIVTAAFEGPTASGEFRVADIAATAPATLVHLEDRREDATGQAVTRRTVTRVQP